MADARQDKAAVGYSLAMADPGGHIAGDACGRCLNYRPNIRRVTGGCVRVEGDISGRYWCRLFEAGRT